ncbi:hypothetical protein SAMN04487967_1444 [Natronorubrum sediminis]|uniref:Uncharacterized protein n=1 Tax=Natronorubrum sediminis TaxID=640943 RepID=A0A1H6FRM4_9EURY|nr:hypothetical protein SAMN04487967_1444 [Natronorubrum sediminis]
MLFNMSQRSITIYIGDGNNRTWEKIIDTMGYSLSYILHNTPLQIRLVIIPNIVYFWQIRFETDEDKSGHMDR